MKNIKLLLFSLFSLFLLYITFKFILTFISFSPKINKIFNELENLENKQELTDSIILLKEIPSMRLYKVNLNSSDTIKLCFIDCKNQLYKENNNIDFTNNTFGLKYIFTNNNNCKIIKNQYYILEGNLPFKFKKILFPYTVTIHKGLILKSIININENE
jgi:hypothetical protein